MSTKSNPPAPKPPETIESVLGPFTEARVNLVADNAVKELALQCITLVVGITRVLTAPADTNEKAVGMALQEVNITVDDAKQLAADGDTLLTSYENKIAKEGEARAASNRVDVTKDHVHDQVQGFSNVIRGELGTKSSSLNLFGVKMLGGRGRRRKTAAADKKKDDKGAAGGSNDGSKS